MVKPIASRRACEMRREIVDEYERLLKASRRARVRDETGKNSNNEKHDNASRRARVRDETLDLAWGLYRAIASRRARVRDETGGVSLILYPVPGVRTSYTGELIQFSRTIRGTDTSRRPPNLLLCQPGIEARETITLFKESLTGTMRCSVSAQSISSIYGKNTQDPNP